MSDELYELELFIENEDGSEKFASCYNCCHQCGDGNILEDNFCSLKDKRLSDIEANDGCSDWEE